jgi:hypothetical protein
MSDREKNASENSPAESEQSVSDEDLSNVSALESELVGDDTKSLNIGKSLFDESELQWTVKNRMLEKADVRLPPQNETVPRPEPDECVVFRDYFAVGLRMPCQDFVEEIMKAYNIEMHHLTPNGMVKIALFIWAVKSRRGNLDIRVFCSIHDMHTQFQSKMVDGKGVIKYFGCCSFKQAHGAKQIAPTSKNKWVKNWYRYWFYHKVSLVEEKNQANRVVRRCPLAARMHKNNFDCKPKF